MARVGIKDKDFDSIVPQISQIDMHQGEKKECIDLALQSYKMSHEGQNKYYKDMAEFIKRNLDQKLGGAWHVIVGRSFGSFVTHETKALIYFWLQHIGFLIFKHG